MLVFIGRQLRAKVKTMRRHCIILLCLAAFLISGCRTHRPDGVMSPRAMEDYLYDYHLANALSDKLPYDEKYKRQLYNNFVLQKHGVTKAIVDTSLVWYTRNPEKLYDIYKRLSSKIEKDEAAASLWMARQEKKSFSVMPGDSVDVWYLPRVQMLTSARYMNPLLFEIPSDTTFYLSDSLVMTVNSTFLGFSEDSVHPLARISLALFYGDSISAIDTVVSSASLSRLCLQCDDSVAFNSIKGDITYLNPNPVPGQALLLSDISILRTHTKREGDAIAAVVDSANIMESLPQE